MENGCKLEYTPLNGNRVVLSEEECERSAKRWQAALVRYVVGKKLGFIAMQKLTQVTWKEIGAPTVHVLWDRVFLFYFGLPKIAEKALARSWFFFQDLLILQPWKPELDITQLRTDKVAVWAQYSDLQMHYWSSENLGKIASFVGRPIVTDQLTTNCLSLGFARVLVEVKLNAELPGKVPVETKWGPSYVCVKYE